MGKEKKDFQINVLWLPVILALGILYVMSPVDVFPDRVPWFGQFDDILIALAIVWFFTSWLPRNLYRTYWFGRRRGSHSTYSADASAEAAAPRQPGFDPFQVLHIAPGSSPAEIKRAYREMMAKYHPDKVSHLGEEFQRLAHGKVVEITKAYEMLSGKE